MNNLLISGPPRSGKTTLIKKVLQECVPLHHTGGFFTEELREAGNRVGFQIITLPGKKTGLLARKGWPSTHQVGKYGVDRESLEALGCRFLSDALGKEKIVIVDEIGKMELFSKKFQDLVMKALDSPQHVLATILDRPHAFADALKKRSDVKLLLLRRDNFRAVFVEVQKWIKNGWQSNKIIF